MRLAFDENARLLSIMWMLEIQGTPHRVAGEHPTRLAKDTEVDRLAF
jgi:hypothetical protein